ncbi:MAG: hypothetical protein H7X80_07710, partial [bacterium]|nr:hypothetical protein [Candidatus Kapabacteria bacterium]
MSILRRISACLPVGLLVAIPAISSLAAAEAGAPATHSKVSLFGMIVGAGPPEYLLILYSVVCFAV